MSLYPRVSNGYVTVSNGYPVASNYTLIYNWDTFPTGWTFTGDGAQDATAGTTVTYFGQATLESGVYDEFQSVPADATLGFYPGRGDYYEFPVRYSDPANTSDYSYFQVQDQNNCLFVRMRGGTSQLVLGETVAGTATELASVSMTLSPGTDYLVQVYIGDGSTHGIGDATARVRYAEYTPSTDTVGTQMGEVTSAYDSSLNTNQGGIRWVTDSSTWYKGRVRGLQGAGR